MSGFGEEELVQALSRIISGAAPGVVLGPGDDAALVEFGPGMGILTTDVMVEGVHFRRDLVAPRDLGYKAVAVNVSDVAAMGGSPRFGLVSLGLPLDLQAGWVAELYGGIRDGADQYGVAIVGGDTSRSEQVVLSVVATGQVHARGAVTRAGARPGDRVVVTGTLGGAAGGLRLAEASPDVVGAAVASDWGRALLAAHFRPTARVGEGQALAQHGASAMMDISDGLAKDLARLCRSSGVAAEIRLADVPAAPELGELARVLPVEASTLALEGGEDFELLATMAPGAVRSAAASLWERYGTPLTEIGEIREGEGLVAVGADGSRRPLGPGGWDHFGG